MYGPALIALQGDLSGPDGVGKSILKSLLVSWLFSCNKLGKRIGSIIFMSNK